MEAVLNVLSYLLWVGLALSILVFVHELGHFLAARLFGMRVDVFSIGFPPVLFRRKRGDTEWRIGAVPLGGYVKIAGMVDESMDTDFVHTEPQPDEYRAKPVWQRMIVISAGVVFNLILAFLIFIGLAAANGEEYIPAENVRGVYVIEGSIAHEMGMRTGDRITGLNGEPLERFYDLFSPDALSADPLTITVARGGETRTFEGPDQLLSRLSEADATSPLEALGISITPALLGAVQSGSPAAAAGLQEGDRIVAIDRRPVRYWNEIGAAVRASEGRPLAVRWTRADSSGTRTLTQAVTPEAAGESYVLGVQSPTLAALTDEFGMQTRRYGPLEAVGAGITAAWTQTTAYVKVMGRLFTGREDLRSSVGGPVMIAQQTKQAADAGMSSFWFLVAMLSIALAVFNILPIPVLDGGHLVFLLYEAVARREPSLKVRLRVQQFGFALLLAFMAFVLFNDVARLVG